MTITDRQKQILRIIDGHWTREGYGPSVRELKEALGVAYGAIYKHMEVLEKKGLLVKPVATWRAARLTEAGKVVIA